MSRLVVFFLFLLSTNTVSQETPKSKTSFNYHRKYSSNGFKKKRRSALRAPFKIFRIYGKNKVVRKNRLITSCKLCIPFVDPEPQAHNIRNRRKR